MSYLNLAQQRYSVRNYLPKPVEEEKLQQILEHARLAPTAANRQPQKVYVLKSEEAIGKIRSVTRMAYNAPVVLLVCYDETLSWKNTPQSFGEDYEGGEVDAAIVTTSMMMQATELGLGTLWVRGYNSADIIKAFDLPAHIKPVCLLLVGYADTTNERPRAGRKPLDEIVEVW